MPCACGDGCKPQPVPQSPGIRHGVGQFKSLFFDVRGPGFIDLGQKHTEKPAPAAESEDQVLQKPFDPACLGREPLCF